MLLVLNCLVKDQYAHNFDDAIMNKLGKVDVKYDIKRIMHLKDAGDLSEYTHLVISGSEASALEDNPWDKLLHDIILHFIEHRKAVLGICYGHQFLARTLVGKECLRKAKKPEIGLAGMNILSNTLFEGMDEPVGFVLHFDEVSHLSDDFLVIASSKACAIQGFQYKDTSVWGVQFHPEYDLTQIKDIIESFAETEPCFNNYYVNEFMDERRFVQTESVIYNFLKA